MVQKEEITALYEEFASTEEELREQNEKLTEYNRQIKRNEERLGYLAYYDMLTGLPNRKMVLEKLDLLIKLSETQPAVFYMVFIDLDNFKKTNDTLGHDFGDAFIQSVAESIKGCICDRDIFGRIGGDEFALIICRELDQEQVFSYVDFIRKSLMKRFHIENREIYSTASFGISMYPPGWLQFDGTAEKCRYIHV